MAVVSRTSAPDAARPYGAPVQARTILRAGLHFGRLRWPQMLLSAAAFLVTLGALIPLVSMLHGALVRDLTYATWTWPAIPAVWIAAMAGVLLARKHRAVGALLIAAAAGAGATAFRPEFGLYTFGSAWAIATLLYFSAAALHSARRDAA